MPVIHTLKPTISRDFYPSLLVAGVVLFWIAVHAVGPVLNIYI